MHRWRFGNHDLDLTHRGLIMGIVNVTPDSFSDGGRFNDPGRAVEHAFTLLAEGADILDVGGESTRPGAEPVGEAEELRRVLPVIRAVRSQTKALISIDTMKAAVARAALEAGADIINDVTGLRGDAAMPRVAAETQAGLIVMHMTGTPQTMQQQPQYDDVVAEVGAYFDSRLRVLEGEGIEPERIVLDPGFGFGKTLEHNLALMRAAAPQHPAAAAGGGVAQIDDRPGDALRGDGRPLLADHRAERLRARARGADRARA
jgi:dihydropteroate synthase